MLQKWKFIVIFLLSLVWSLENTLWPYLLRLFIDTFNQFDGNRMESWQALKGLIIAGASLFIFVEVCCRYRDYLKASGLPQLEADIRMTMFDHVQRHSPKYFNEHFSGSLSNKISDMTTQVTLLIQNALLFFPSFATCVISMFFFYRVNPLFTLILGCWILVHLSICFMFARWCSLCSNIHGEARSSLVGKIVDSFSNNFTVNLFHRFRYERSYLGPYQNREQETNAQAAKAVVWMFSTLSVLYVVGAFVINGFMITRWMQGSLTTGETIQIFNTTWNVLMVLWFSGEAIPQFFQSVGIASQALNVMKDPQDVLDKPGATPLVVKRGEIVFENVSFHYGAKQLFQNKGVHIKAGEKVGLVGYSGAGKSTFVNLILRFYPVEKGKILIDGQNIADATLESLRAQVTLIPQDPLLFHRSLEENIRYGRVDASQEDVVRVAKLAHCDEFIRKCPAGYATLVGERGTKLSGGERQRIAIARALLADTPILIMDEATSALDSVTERCIQESLESLMQNRTAIVVAHRLSTLAKMDRILVFDQGKIIEQGSHLELLAQNGHYARLWNMQAGGFLPDATYHK